MFPANSNHLRKLPAMAPKSLHHLLEHRSCRVIKSADTKWSAVKHVKLYVKLESSSSPFSAFNYPRICNAMVTPMYLNKKKGSNATTIFQVRSFLVNMIHNFINEY